MKQLAPTAQAPASARFDFMPTTNLLHRPIRQQLHDIRSGDLFNYLIGTYETLSQLISRDLSINCRNKHLSYHINAAQRDDIKTFLLTLAQQHTRLSGWNIDLVLSNIKPDALTAAQCMVTNQLSIFRNCTDFLLRVYPVLMNNDNPSDLDAFSNRFPSFTGIMCNLGGAQLLDNGTFASFLWQTTRTAGWVQTDNIWIMKGLLALRLGTGGIQLGLDERLDGDRQPIALQFSHEYEFRFTAILKGVIWDDSSWLTRTASIAHLAAEMAHG